MEYAIQCTLWKRPNPIKSFGESATQNTSFVLSCISDNPLRLFWCGCSVLEKKNSAFSGSICI